MVRMADFGGYTPGNDHIGPTEREVRKIIDSKCHFLGDMLVPWRVCQ